jgi:hypothetical protein
MYTINSGAIDCWIMVRAIHLWCHFVSLGHIRQLAVRPDGPASIDDSVFFHGVAVVDGQLTSVPGAFAVCSGSTFSPTVGASMAGRM